MTGSKRRRTEATEEAGVVRQLDPQLLVYLNLLAHFSSIKFYFIVCVLFV